jgi:hypothetical protein
MFKTLNSQYQQFGITPPSNQPYTTLTIHGQYIAGGMETDVSVSGVHPGRHAPDNITLSGAQP